MLPQEDKIPTAMDLELNLGDRPPPLTLPYNLLPYDDRTMIQAVPLYSRQPTPLSLR